MAEHVPLVEAAGETMRLPSGDELDLAGAALLRVQRATCTHINHGSLSSPTAIDMSVASQHTVTMAADGVALNLSPPVAGEHRTGIVFYIRQGASGGEQPVFSDNVLWPGGTQPSFDAPPNGVDVVTMISDGVNYFAAKLGDLR